MPWRLAPYTVGSDRSIFVQAIPSDVWIIDYVGDSPPTITVVLDGQEVLTEKEFLEDQHRVLVKFGAPTTGRAYLS